MPNPQDDRNLSVGRWRHAGNRSKELDLFLKAIRAEAPQVLKDLFERVLPLHREARRRRALRAPEDEDPSDFWTVYFDFDTWQSAWDWADRAHLSRGMALELLKTPRAVKLAHWCREQTYWRRNKRLPRELDFPFRVNSSPEITFGMPLLEVVWFTLESWAESDSQEDDLRWALNDPLEQVRKVADPEEVLKSIEHLRQCPRLRRYLGPTVRAIALQAA
jgi:hypothetical protein